MILVIKGSYMINITSNFIRQILPWNLRNIPTDSHIPMSQIKDLLGESVMFTCSLRKRHTAISALVNT